MMQIEMKRDRVLFAVIMCCACSSTPPASDAGTDAAADAEACIQSGELCVNGPSGCCSNVCGVTSPDPGSDAGPVAICK